MIYLAGERAPLELNEMQKKKKRQKTTANFHCDSRPLQSLLLLRDTGKT